MTQSSMTQSSVNRIGRLYERVIGYNPIDEGCDAFETLETLREYRKEYGLYEGDAIELNRH